MSYHDQRLATDLEQIREGIFDLGIQVENALRNAVKSLLTRDSKLAYRTIVEDNPINRRSEELDKECHYFIARHLPSAGHLRFISSALRMIILLERMGDYAVTICRETVQIRVPLEGSFRDELEELAKEAILVFSHALKSFRTEDEALARTTIADARKTERVFGTTLKLLIEAPTPLLEKTDLFGRLIILSQLERVSDQAKNLCEETLFFITGERKERRPVRILFIDPVNAGLGMLAASIGRTFFADRATFHYCSETKSPDGTNEYDTFTESHDLIIDATSAWQMEDLSDKLATVDVVIGLNVSYSKFVDVVPFHTVAMDWQMKDDSDKNPGSAYRYLRQEIEDLVLTMRGTRPARAE